MSRSSTPPTDISIAPSSPTFALPIDTAESIHRRRQSDSASAEIGKRLLKGLCRSTDHVELTLTKLVRSQVGLCSQMNVRMQAVMVSPWFGLRLSVEKILGSLTKIMSEGMRIVPPEYIDAHNLVPSRGKGKEKATAYISPDGEASAGDSKVADRIIANTGCTSECKCCPVLADTSTSLELALHSLSQRLTSLSSLPAVLEPSAIGFTADAMGKVLRVLAQVEKLRDRTGS
ncbi:hypothetical protein EW145_g48 [Phellinidium pouzarii]|uniref:Uncharacterized protein n=1 Tax=Phellinidium pouzarii TaxID=167371 RepID=A0A4S4LLT4_9AGAM|nr:hypothetical protein EW145_g48 [Phellinidium pouzarii]